MNDKIKELQAQIEAEKNKIANCKHEFGKPFTENYTVKEGYGSKMIVQGSDIWYEHEGYRDVTKTRYGRKCINCGFTEYTEKTKPVISNYEPDFSK